jgi:hypothetical protein
MSRSIPHGGEMWTAEDEWQLRQMSLQDATTAEIARKLGRTVAAVYAKASELGIGLTPNDPPQASREDG